MKSHEVLKQSVEGVGVKTIASDLGVSPSLLYKWCQPGSEPTDSGATNPLDRLAQIFEATGDEQIISWLCQKADGSITSHAIDLSFLQSKMLQAI